MADKLLGYEEAIKKYDPTFGIEVHVELATKTKMFCPAPNPAYDNNLENLTHPNTMLTPVSLGLPGALPVLNKQAVEYAIKIGLALNCEIAEKSVFSRKNYFYPDMTKNFQTSQYDLPTCINGYVDVELDDGEVFRVDIERAHLEEDAGKNNHVGGAEGRIQGADHSLVDYNRAGVPLIEIVTRPVFNTGKRAPEVAAAYVRTLRDIFKAIGVSNAQMERGNVRADVNLSLAPAGSGKLGTRTETKNVNSFSAIEAAAKYEIRRQGAVLDSGADVFQETRMWHEASNDTSSGRPKSDADDYRYFPEPDLMPLYISREKVEEVRATLPELPQAKRNRLKEEYGFKPLEMRDVINAEALNIIEDTVKKGATPQGARKWWMNEALEESRKAWNEGQEPTITPDQIAAMDKLVQEGKINDKIARQVLDAMIQGEGDDPAKIVADKGLEVVNDDGALIAAIQEAFAKMPKAKTDIAGGNQGAAGPIIGMVMKATGGQADGKRVRELILEEAAK
ncbi:MAG: Asp-tRNA(Asn)/Glu-tRNA(Gln) amidotransferase subunit GatB [Candidatus Ancillula sp.]|jgi:aspartyl-tRNA(Asn)/glutamyl-tRNA(Gln) amidotransferase subunit B|nr:Asp-tRNA(Asn)/Glu-tRNA(Gln) amidotransferase subunit GatB [Candidatus Ancillula sp.]